MNMYDLAKHLKRRHEEYNFLIQYDESTFDIVIHVRNIETEQIIYKIKYVERFHANDNQLLILDANDELLTRVY